MFRRERDTGSGAPLSHSPRASAQGALSFRKSSPSSPPVMRPSRGLEQFFFNIRDLIGLSILDLAGASQENISYLTSLGHKVYSADIVRSLDDTFGPNPAEQTNPGRIESFMQAHFEYPAGTFDGVLLWDSLQFMGPALLSATVDKLHKVM